MDLERLRGFPAPTAESEQRVQENLGLARQMAGRMATLSKMPYDDLYLAALVGLLKGCRKYNPELINEVTGRSYMISTFVVPFIRGAMLHWLRDHGHSSGVKFPDAWRDHAPTVRRMANQGSTVQAVVEATGLSAQDVEEILQAQGATRLFDPDVHSNASYDLDVYDPDPLDEAETYDELAECLRIADEAYSAMRWADQRILVSSWNMPRKRRLAYLQHQDFMRLVGKVIRKEPVTIMKQTGIGIEIGSTESKTTKRPSNNRDKDAEILKAAEKQLELLWAQNLEDLSGKTSTAEIGSSSASADQPSDKSG